MKFLRTQKNIYDFLKTVTIFLLATVAALALSALGALELNIILLYLVGILLITIETKGYVWGIGASVTAVFTFNFFFTAPRFTFQIKEPDYVLSLVLFFVVSIVTSTLVSRLQVHTESAKHNEKQAKLLHNVSLGFLNMSGNNNILRYATKVLNEIQECTAVIYYTADIAEDDTLGKWCVSNMIPCGYGTAYFSNSQWKYIPIKSKFRVFGIASFFCKDKDIAEDDMVFINAIVSQMAMAIEREEISSNQEHLRIEMEKEQLQSNILRSISHDLRTPLTSIAGSSSFLISSFDDVDKETALGLLNDINFDAIWLSQQAENLLSTTRISEGKIQLKKQAEVVDDIIYAASGRMERFMKNHSLSVSVPEKVVSVDVDSHLITQVVINLLDNAIKHTPDGSKIALSAYEENNYIAFEVSDNGQGIKNGMNEKIFTGFVTAEDDEADSHRGMGLGLSICKAIVEAHQGTIVAFNNKQGGATFKVMLPLNKRGGAIYESSGSDGEGKHNIGG